MSSESEDDFLSADEGSDNDESSQPTTTQSSQPTTTPHQSSGGRKSSDDKKEEDFVDQTTLAENKEDQGYDNQKIENRAPVSESKKQKNYDIQGILEQENLAQNKELEGHSKSYESSRKGKRVTASNDSSTKQKETSLLTKDKEASPSKDELEDTFDDTGMCKTEDEDAKCSVTQKIQSKAESERETVIDDSRKIDADTDSVDNVVDAIKDLKVDDVVSNEEAGQTEITDKRGDKNLNQKIVEEVVNADKICSSKLISDKDDVIEEKRSSIMKEDNESVPRRPRESKIGKKKPREKLGERLGVKKLGSKIEKKPVEGLSSDDMKVSVCKSDKSNKLYTGSPEKGESKGDDSWDRGESEREAEKRKEREREEERWQLVQEEQQQQQQQQSEGGDGWGGGWGGWGSTLLSAATTFTREVGRGVGTVVETVESGLGVPDAETLAREAAELRRMAQEVEKQTATEASGDTEASSESEVKDTEPGGGGGGGGLWLGSLVSGMSGALESASNKVLLGGLDTLETIGRKAMDAIQDGDPGLRKKRAFLANAKPNLAQVLQDARTRATEKERQETEGEGREGGGGRGAIGATLETAWDGTEGGVHMEALSLVARQCQTKNTAMMNSIPHYLRNSLNASNVEIKNACEISEDEDLERDQEEDLGQHLADIITRMDLPLNSAKITQALTRVQDVVIDIETQSEAAPEEMSKEEEPLDKDGDNTTQKRKAVAVNEVKLYRGVAEVVTEVVALTHKGSEMALTTPHIDPLTLASQFRELSCVVLGRLDAAADRMCGMITKCTTEGDTYVNNTITNIYLQVSHGNQYIQQSIGYLSPILQYLATKRAAADL